MPFLFSFIFLEKLLNLQKIFWKGNFFISSLLIKFLFTLICFLFFFSNELRITKIILIGIVVLITMGLCFLPFLTSKESILQVIHRIFPIGRGLFEDKVANFWCASSIVYKFKNHFTLSQLSLMRLAF